MGKHRAHRLRDPGWHCGNLCTTRCGGWRRPRRRNDTRILGRFAVVGMATDPPISPVSMLTVCTPPMLLMVVVRDWLTRKLTLCRLELGIRQDSALTQRRQVLNFIAQRI